MKVLVIAAHPDDEVIGCGGAIARHAASGDKVYLLVMTQIYAPEWDMKEFDKRRKEAFKAAKVLGIKQVFFGGFPTAKLNTVPTITLTNKIAESIKKIKPEMIYLPSKEDLNLDHVIVCQAGISACKSYGFIKTMLSYEVPTAFSFENMEANYFVDISKYFTKKIQAMKAYKTEIRKYPHPRSVEGLTILSQVRGMAVGVRYAEAFKVIRKVVA
jgi:LmbE family N-acetylglucosaminyl deacetylase